MSKHRDDEDRKPRRKGDRIAAWMLTGMLVLGLGGFGVTNFSGQVSSIGSVGDVTITTQDYARAIRQETAAIAQQYGMQLGMTEALTFGLDKQALSSVVTRAALDNEVQRLGLSIGDDQVAAEVMKMDSFKGPSGKFERDTYAFALKQQGWSENEFETALRRDVSRSLLQGAITGGFAAPQPMVDTLYRFIAERRSVSMLRLGEGDLAQPVAAPTEEDLKAWYDSHIEAFTRPEARRIAYAALLPEDIAADQPVDEAALQKMYDDRIDEFMVPERRLVERLVYPDQAAADEAKARFDAGTPFETLVTDRGLTMTAVDMGDVSKADLGQLGDAVFAAAEGEVIQAETDLGPALFRINGVLLGEETSFDEAHDDLAAEMQADAARRAIEDKVEEIDNLLAGGAELPDLATELGMTYATLDHVPGQQGSEKIEGYSAFRTAADAVTAADFPEAIVLDDGGVVALQFLETVPAAPIPFDEAREAVAEAWQAAKLAEALSARAIEMKAAIEGGAAIGSLGIVDQTPELSREGSVGGAPASLVTDAFAMSEGEVRVVEDGDFIAILQLNRIIPAAETGENAEALKAALATQIEQALANDAMADYSTALIDAAGVSLDQAAITAVNSSLQ
ncbi:MAG: SurA N-terminal domain-containing protein [Paracoccaceae bacterium]